MRNLAGIPDFAFVTELIKILFLFLIDIVPAIELRLLEYE